MRDRQTVSTLPPSWVSTVLGAPPGASADEARAGFLRRLPADDFAPPEQSVGAVNVLARATLPISTEAASPEAGAVERFASEFWALPPTLRRARWTELSGATTAGPAVIRLRELEPGLDVTAAPHPNPLVEEVAGVVREWFTLDRRGRAVRRATFLAGVGNRAPALQDAARWLSVDIPGLAQLAPGLLDPLIDGPPLTAIDARVVTPTEMVYQQLSHPLRDLQRATERAAATSNTGTDVGKGAIGIIFLLAIVGKLIFAGTHSASRYQAPPNPSYNVPNVTIPPLPNTNPHGLPTSPKQKRLTSDGQDVDDLQRALEQANKFLRSHKDSSEQGKEPSFPGGPTPPKKGTSNPWVGP